MIVSSYWKVVRVYQTLATAFMSGVLNEVAPVVKIVVSGAEIYQAPKHHSPHDCISMCHNS